MASPHASEGAPRSALSRLLTPLGLPLLLAATAGAGFASGLHVAGAPSSSWIAFGSALLIALAAAFALQRRAGVPLATAATILDALRHGDYAHRARVDELRGAPAALLLEVNELA